MTGLVEGIEGALRVTPDTVWQELYVWSSECIVEECGCGQGLVLSSTAAMCRCGADHTALIRKELLPNSR